MPSRRRSVQACDSAGAKITTWPSGTSLAISAATRAPETAGFSPTYAGLGVRDWPDVERDERDPGAPRGRYSRRERAVIDDRDRDPVGLVVDRRLQSLGGLLPRPARGPGPLDGATDERGGVLRTELRGNEQRVERIAADKDEAPARMVGEVAPAADALCQRSCRTEK